MISKQMKSRKGKVLIALLPVLTVFATWLAWNYKFVPLLEAYENQGNVLEKQLDKLDRRILTGEISQSEAIDKLKGTLINIQEADEEIMLSIKFGMIFLFLAVGVGAFIGTIRVIFLELRNDNEN